MRANFANAPYSESELRRQAWKFWFVATAWPAYLIVLGAVFAAIGWWSLILMATLGVFLFNWVALLIHESWHGYVPNIDNRRFFHALSWMLFADPQLLDTLHADHHARVTTWEDREVHPFGEIRSRPRRILNNALELAFGMLYVNAAWHAVVASHPRYRDRYRLSGLATSTVAWIVFAGVVIAGSHLLFGLDVGQIVIPLLVTFWLGALSLHYSTLIQHGNVAVDGDLAERNRWVRSLRPSGALEKLFLVLTHQDQVLHHTHAGIYWRPFRNNRVEVPVDAVTITCREFLRLVGDMLVGRTTDHRQLGARVAAVLVDQPLAASRPNPTPARRRRT